MMRDIAKVYPWKTPPAGTRPWGMLGARSALSRGRDAGTWLRVWAEAAALDAAGVSDPETPWHLTSACHGQTPPVLRHPMGSHLHPHHLGSGAGSGHWEHWDIA